MAPERHFRPVGSNGGFQRGDPSPAQWDQQPAEVLASLAACLDAHRLLGITAIKHEGVALSPHQTDQMIRVAAERLISTLICRSLDLDSAAVKHRFEFAA